MTTWNVIEINEGAERTAAPVELRIGNASEVLEQLGVSDMDVELLEGEDVYEVREGGELFFRLELA